MKKLLCLLFVSLSLNCFAELDIYEQFLLGWNQLTKQEQKIISDEADLRFDKKDIDARDTFYISVLRKIQTNKFNKLVNQ